MNDDARTALVNIINNYADRNPLGDVGLCLAMLKDMCPRLKLEVNLLHLAHKEGIPDALQRQTNPTLHSFNVDRLTRRLVDGWVIEEESARWAVESWALALSSEERGEEPPPPPDVGDDEGGDQTFEEPDGEGDAGAGLSVGQKGSSPAKRFTNSIGMEFALIPAGSFMMGSPAGKEKRSSDETQHKVTISKPFYLQVTQVTQRQWKAVMGNNPSHFKGDNNPVEQVSWNDAQEFIKSLNQKEGTNKYRLPTEAQWEYACRAGTKTPFSFGNTISTDQANYDGNYKYGNGRKGVYRRKTTAVKSFPANAFGLYDMHGNVWELCTDWYGDYPSGPVTDPTGAPGGKYRVIRGGSWLNFPIDLRSAGRFRNSTFDRDDLMGFRVARITP